MIRSEEGEMHSRYGLVILLLFTSFADATSAIAASLHVLVAVRSATPEDTKKRVG